MKNRSIRRKPDMPQGQSRREILVLAGLLPLAQLMGAEAFAGEPETGGIVMRDGWILRRDDLKRLAIA